MDLPFGAPPVLVEMKSQVQNYLENPQLLPIHDLEMVQQYWKHEMDVKQLCFEDIAATPTTLLVERDANTGALAEVTEIMTPHAGMTNKTSMSLQRIPGKWYKLPLFSHFSSIFVYKVHLANGSEEVLAMFHFGLAAYSGIHQRLCQLY